MRVPPFGIYNIYTMEKVDYGAKGFPKKKNGNDKGLFRVLCHCPRNNLNDGEGSKEGRASASADFHFFEFYRK